MVTRSSPVRTCVGCRQRGAADELLRVVVAPDPARGGHPAVVPDPRHRMSGRGAWVHPEPACIELAQRRRAFARALREPAATNSDAVQEFVGNSAAPINGTETGIPAGGTP